MTAVAINDGSTKVVMLVSGSPRAVFMLWGGVFARKPFWSPGNFVMPRWMGKSYQKQGFIKPTLYTLNTFLIFSMIK